MTASAELDRKARFVDFLRRVREGERLLITLHGEPVAELRPVDTAAESLDARLRRLERHGLPVRTAWDFRPLAGGPAADVRRREPHRPSGLRPG